jgi:3-isopropylmalate/(R)-2-methylmalate dehydratase small subunit
VKPFHTLTALVASLDRADVDTDAILPKQFLVSLSKSGYADALFAGWRYRKSGELATGQSERVLNPDFALNEPRYRGAELLLCRRNFGCGSSREQAPWALRDYGFRALIAPSYGAIFYDNCLKNGLLPVVLAESIVDRLFAAVAARSGYRLTIDLPAQMVQTPEGESLPFTIDAFRKRCLIESLDDISYALGHAEKIRAFEASHREAMPWLYRPSQ